MTELKPVMSGHCCLWGLLVAFILSDIHAASAQTAAGHADEPRVTAKAAIIAADSPERIVWRKTPIAVPLTVGQERLIHFPDSVSVGLPQSLTSRLRSQSINGTLYLLARQPFEATRILVRTESGGPLFVLDVSAEVGGKGQRPLADVEVVLDQPRTTDPQIAVTGKSHPLLQGGYVALTRYAAQQLYAPERLIPNRPGVVVVPVKQAPVDLLRGGSVDAVPVMAWKAGFHYVTAVRLTNRASSAVVLDPRELRGGWLAATFQHNRLLPAGTEADTTAVYLISDRPFDVAL